jgi:hypothetical protein
VYPNAQNKGKTWGLRLVYPGCLVGGQFKGAEFTLLDALFAAHAHCAKETVTKEALRPIAFAILKRKPAKEPPHPRVCAWGW